MPHLQLTVLPTAAQRAHPQTNASAFISQQKKTTTPPAFSAHTHLNVDILSITSTTLVITSSDTETERSAPTGGSARARPSAGWREGGGEGGGGVAVVSRMKRMTRDNGRRYMVLQMNACGGLWGRGRGGRCGCVGVSIYVMLCYVGLTFYHAFCPSSIPRRSPGRGFGRYFGCLGAKEVLYRGRIW
jgi:hypothetical protein